MKTKVKEDRNGNVIFDGSWNVEPHIFDFSDYPQISYSVSNSETTETTYVNFYNAENNKQITVRFSMHDNNAVKFGDQLDGNFYTKNEVLYHLGLKKRVFVPKTRLWIITRQVAKVDIPSYEMADLTIKEMYALGANADISMYVGKIAKDSNYLILSDTIIEEAEKKSNMFGEVVTIGNYTYL